MYKTNRGQTSIFDNPINFIGAKLDPTNRWIQIASLIPWELVDKKYSKQFEGSKTGNPAKTARMALGSHIIKKNTVFLMKKRWNSAPRGSMNLKGRGKGMLI